MRKSWTLRTTTSTTPLLLSFIVFFLLVSAATASAASLWPRPSKMVRFLVNIMRSACVEWEQRRERRDMKDESMLTHLSTQKKK